MWVKSPSRLLLVLWMAITWKTTRKHDIFYEQLHQCPFYVFLNKFGKFSMFMSCCYKIPIGFLRGLGSRGPSACVIEVGVNGFCFNS